MPWAWIVSFLRNWAIWVMSHSVRSWSSRFFWRRASMVDTFTLLHVLEGGICNCNFGMRKHGCHHRSLHHCSTSLAIFAWCLFYSRVLSMHYKYFCAMFPKIEFCPCIILFSYSVRSICTVWFDTPLLTVTNCISPWIKFGLCIILFGCTLFPFLLSGILSVYFILFSLEEFCLGFSLLFQLSYTKFSLCTS